MGVRRKTALVIPAYNAGKTLGELIAGLSERWPLERTLFVDDGSVDDTARILVEKKVTFIRFGENQGKGAALQAGYRWAKANGFLQVVTIDADAQHDPAEIDGLLSCHEAVGGTLTVGTRFPGADKMPRGRQLSNFLTSLVVSIFSSRRIRDCQCGFRAVSVDRSAVGLAKDEGFMFESEQLFVNGALGVRIGEAPISCSYENEGSHIRPLFDTLKFFRLIWRRMWY